MTKTEESELEFYKNGSAENVLKRFEFSEEETRLIQDAIRTANMPKPRMQLIHQVDALLKEVVKNRTPIVHEKKTQVSADAMAKIELMKLSSESKKESSISLFGFKSKYGIGAVILISVVMIAVQYLSVKPRNDETQRLDNLLHGKR